MKKQRQKPSQSIKTRTRRPAGTASAPSVDDALLAPVAVAAAASKHLDADVALAENCTLRDAGALKSELLKLQEKEPAVRIDIGKVERIETANLQILSAFTRDRAAIGRSVTWVGESPAFTQAATLLGLQALLALGNNA